MRYEELSYVEYLVFPGLLTTTIRKLKEQDKNEAIRNVLVMITQTFLEMPYESEWSVYSETFVAHYLSKTQESVEEHIDPIAFGLFDRIARATMEAKPQDRLYLPGINPVFNHCLYKALEKCSETKDQKLYMSIIPTYFEMLSIKGQILKGDIKTNQLTYTEQVAMAEELPDATYSNFKAKLTNLQQQLQFALENGRGQPPQWPSIPDPDIIHTEPVNSTGESDGLLFYFKKCVNLEQRQLFIQRTLQITLSTLKLSLVQKCTVLLEHMLFNSPSDRQRKANFLCNILALRGVRQFVNPISAIKYSLEQQISLFGEICEMAVPERKAVINFVSSLLLYVESEDIQIMQTVHALILRLVEEWRGRQQTDEFMSLLLCAIIFQIKKRPEKEKLSQLEANLPNRMEVISLLNSSILVDELISLWLGRLQSRFIDPISLAFRSVLSATELRRLTQTLRQLFNLKKPMGEQTGPNITLYLTALLEKRLALPSSQTRPLHIALLLFLCRYRECAEHCASYLMALTSTDDSLGQDAITNAKSITALLSVNLMQLNRNDNALVLLDYAGYYFEEGLLAQAKQQLINGSNISDFLNQENVEIVARLTRKEQQYLSWLQQDQNCIFLSDAKKKRIFKQRLTQLIKKLVSTLSSKPQQ